MAGTFPTLSCGASAMYPLRLRWTCPTVVEVSPSGAEQRYKSDVARIGISATLRNLRSADVDALITWHDNQKGMFDSTWSWAIGAWTFTNMRLESDDLNIVQEAFELWRCDIQASGFAPAVTDPGSLPALASGAITQLPYTRRRSYETITSEVPTANVRHAFAMRGGGTSGLPTTPVLAWTINWTEAPEAKATEMIGYFLGRHGRFGSFSFTDPDTTTVHTGCRFADDSLDVAYRSYNSVSLAVTVEKR